MTSPPRFETNQATYSHRDHDPAIKDQHNGLYMPIPTSTMEGEGVRVEEITIVSLILVLWVCAIMLFVHRWGKIRMLVPHQPRYAYAAAKAAETIPVRTR